MLTESEWRAEGLAMAVRANVNRARRAGAGEAAIVAILSSLEEAVAAEFDHVLLTAPEALADG